MASIFTGQGIYEAKAARGPVSTFMWGRLRTTGLNRVLKDKGTQEIWGIFNSVAKAPVNTVT
jgi:hypothetical protein